MMKSFLMVVLLVQAISQVAAVVPAHVVWANDLPIPVELTCYVQNAGVSDINSQRVFKSQELHAAISSKGYLGLHGVVGRDTRKGITYYSTQYKPAGTLLKTLTLNWNVDRKGIHRWQPAYTTLVSLVIA